MFKLNNNIKKIYTENEIVSKTNLINFTNYLFNLSNEKCFTKLFEVEIDEITKKTIINSIEGRNIVSLKNNLPDFMKRDNQSSIDVKSLSTEVTFSYILRGMNKGSKVKLQTPELNTITPNKEKPDYILDNTVCKLFFDMKSQGLNKSVNINKIAHDRAVSQGLTFYIVGIINSEKIEDLNNIIFYHLPLKYFLEKSKFINTGKYSENPRNHYYSIDIKDINEYALFKG